MSLPRLFAQEGLDKAMMVIEVVKKPTLWNYVEKYFYLPVLIIIIIFIIWRRIKAE